MRRTECGERRNEYGVPSTERIGVREGRVKGRESLILRGGGEGSGTQCLTIEKRSEKGQRGNTVG